ncbi:bifunctional DNA primase/polymerase [Kutzneria albida]|uniref:bifunctional DNA primase/polymerase n=1 Tax=Kutzneria albida TaxID=43357 RepID=UPI00046D059D|nr:bifunctional DNA primase/polymerase [Kutzneria albida]
MTPPRHDRADPVPQRQFRRAALDYAAHGWPVVPAAHFDGRRYVCVQVDCEEDGPHPVWRLWQDRASTDPATVSSWYRLFSFAVALATGVVFDVLELPESAAIRVQAALTEAGHTTPVAVWRERECRLFWTRPGLDPAAVTVPGARVRGAGNWVPAPPTPTRRGAVQWAVSPEQAEWQPVEPAALIAALALAGVAGDAVR